ncbi:uncharacterized protein LOC129566696 isoform X1 [Sitodiplosis mosellana]|uniref:uncharacterized protein LOC129566696 isoform X1 n=1 Tax=Sitodiplosis mosellana TaxID=263140 RepID=UPI00244486C0|nr:uncharacterized protein LOC129566696 isoform X1 [Sitodiplosis mosellana]
METAEELELGVIKAREMLNSKGFNMVFLCVKDNKKINFPDINEFLMTSEQHSSAMPTINLTKIDVDDEDGKIDLCDDGNIDFWRKELSISLERAIKALTALKRLGHDLKKQTKGKSQILKRYTYKKSS